ncbi:hypothetical protein PENTCL1PPCAC_16989, partial [Pristionchus entomophagus]
HKMARGARLDVPSDPIQEEKYRQRRQKNNESATKHRQRTRDLLAKAKEYEEKTAHLTSEIGKIDGMIADAEMKKTQLLKFIYSHDCVSSKEDRALLFNTMRRASTGSTFSGLPITHPVANRFAFNESPEDAISSQFDLSFRRLRLSSEMNGMVRTSLVHCHIRLQSDGGSSSFSNSYANDNSYGSLLSLDSDVMRDAPDLSEPAQYSLWINSFANDTYHIDDSNASLQLEGDIDFSRYGLP